MFFFQYLQITSHPRAHLEIFFLKRAAIVRKRVSLVWVHTSYKLIIPYHMADPAPCLPSPGLFFKGLVLTC